MQMIICIDDLLKYYARSALISRELNRNNPDQLNFGFSELFPQN